MMSRKLICFFMFLHIVLRNDGFDIDISSCNFFISPFGVSARKSFSRPHGMRTSTSSLGKRLICKLLECMTP